MRQKEGDDCRNDGILDVQEKPKDNQPTEQPMAETELYYSWYLDGLGTGGRLVLQMLIPQSLVYDVSTSSHGDVSAGHYGIRKTYHTLKLSYFWRGMMRDVINWIQSCHLCNATKKPTKPFRSGLQPLPCFRPGECWAMDILGPLKRPIRVQSTD